MYLKVLAILPSGDSDGLMLRPAALGDPDPAAVDHVVEMVQFLQEDMLSALADRCELTPAIVDSVSRGREEKKKSDSNRMGSLVELGAYQPPCAFTHLFLVIPAADGRGLCIS